MAAMTTLFNNVITNRDDADNKQFITQTHFDIQQVNRMKKLWYLIWQLMLINVVDSI